MPDKTASVVFILTSVILTYVNSWNPTEVYVIRRDIFSGLKAPEYTIYDASEKQVLYRLESDFGFTQGVRVLRQPSKEEVGRLKEKVNLFLFKADISVLNPHTNEWNKGSIAQSYKFMGNSFDINWQIHRIKVETKPFEYITNFYDEDQQVLAQIQRRIVFSFSRKYILNIFSEKYPVQMYLLGLAVDDRLRLARLKG